VLETYRNKRVNYLANVSSLFIVVVLCQGTASNIEGADIIGCYVIYGSRGFLLSTSKNNTPPREDRQ
jgi:hypothetical protein